MNDKIKVFIKVIYYFSAFTLGIFLAIFIPNRLVYKYTMDIIVDSLNEKKYSDAMIYMGGYYNSDYVYQVDFGNNSGIVLFESVTLRNNVSATTTASTKYRLEYAYSGFIYNVKDYNVKRLSNNSSKILLYDNANKTQSISILDLDSDGDSYFDTNNTLDDRGFIYLNFQNTELKNLNKIEFLDCEGKVFKSFDLSTVNYKFNFEGKFFTDVTEFLNEYNSNNNSDKLKTLDEKFRAISNKYIYSTYKNSSGSKATTISIIIIVSYFLGVYLFGDLVLGRRHTWKALKFILTKVFKVKFKEKPRKGADSSIINDYKTTVTISLDLSKVKEKDLFQDEVNISYNSEYEIIDFKLTKGNNYKEVKQVRNGDYTNFKHDLSSKYEFVGYSSSVNISGFKTNILLIVRDKEGGYLDE